MRAAIYARYSSDLQSESSNEDQFRICERLASQQGLTVVSRFSDAGISGGTTERSGYQALLVAARAKAFDVLVVEDISRLWRSRAEYGPRSAELEDLGLHMVTDSGDDTRRDGWGLMLGIKSAMAEQYRKEVSYRTRRGLEGRALAGLSVGGKCYGYAPGEVDVVRRIYAMAAAGARPGAIAQTLNWEGVPGPRGPRWSLNAVKRVTRNPRYKGDISWGRTQLSGGARDSRSKRPVERAGGPLVRRVDPEAQLVASALWEAANAS
jgi:DNA invertase Pin-like site-specific DNA recombinase